jgi:pilus assembly protein CpaC
MLSRFVMPLTLCLVALAATAAAQRPEAVLQAEATKELRMETGETRLLHVSTNVVRVSVADPLVADVQVVTQQQLLITGKAVGYTQVVVWGARDEPLVIAVSVTKNLDQLRAQFRELFPNEKIQVSAVGDLLVLSGTVGDLRLPARASEVAQLYTERLANLIQVTGDQQVQLDVRFAEVSRVGMRRAGAEFLWRDTQRGYIGGLSSANTAPGQYLTSDLYIPGTGSGSGPPVLPAPPQGSSFDFFFSTDLADFPFSAMLSILSEEGLAKVLAEPTLVALSGQEAEFHAGGEIPIVLAQQLGTFSVRYKKFGVKLRFTPTVLSERTLSLNLGVEVSEPDPSVGVVLTGFTVPAFKTRSSNTTVRLKDGQSFAVAGLLSDQVKSSIAKVPGLGDLPILGALFRSAAYRRDETELLVVVTAHLVRPLRPGEVPMLPGEDEYNDPNDFELFFLGKLEPDPLDEDEDGDAARPSQANTRASATASTPPPAPAPAVEPRPANAPPPPPAAATPPSTSVPSRYDAPSAAREGLLGPIGFMHGGA